MSSESNDQKKPVECIEIANYAAVRVLGNIDEHFDPTTITPRSENIVFDLAGVETVTSSGICEWSAMIKQLQQAHSKLFFFNCGPQIVNQFNMVGGFGGDGQVVSLFAPYMCDRCAEERNVLVDLLYEHAAIANFEEPEAACPVCGDEMEFDEVPNIFFSYVATKPRPEFPPSGMDFCRRAGVVTGRGLNAAMRIRKAVSGETTLVKLYGRIDKSFSSRAFQGLDRDVIFDFSEVEGVRAGGAAKLARAMGKARDTARNMWITAVSPVLVRVLNQDKALAPILEDVASFCAPFRCDGCGGMVSEEIWVDEHIDVLSQRKIPELVCSRCFSGLHPDFESDYLSFVPAAPPPPLSSVAMNAARDSEKFLNEASLESSFHNSSTIEPSRTANNQMSPGETLGKYRLERFLGAGGMAEVFLARQSGPQGFEKEVVLKRILPHLARNTEFVEQFLDEARLTARFSHPNIVQIYELCEEGSDYFIAMEYVDGEDLVTVLKKCRRSKHYIPVPIALRITYDLLTALHYAHTQEDRVGNPLGVIHRDVSLNNVLLSRNGIIKLVDFGIAKAASKIRETKPGLIKGKTYYMAPEQLRGIEIDHRVDIYGAGVVLFELLTFTHVFRGESDATIMYAQAHEDPPPPSSRRVSLSNELDGIVLRALAKDRDRRYPTAEAFANALNNYCVRELSGLPRTSVLKLWIDKVGELQAAYETREHPVLSGAAEVIADDLAEPEVQDEDTIQIRALDGGSSPPTPAVGDNPGSPAPGKGRTDDGD